MGCCNKTIPGKWLLAIAAIGLVIGVGRFFVEHVIAEEAPAVQEPAVDVPAVLDFTVKSIDDEDVKLDRYYGDVVLIVNVASECGLTPQYKALQELHEAYAPVGLSILGFPANNFGKQEPGSNDDIAEFCEENYGVEFDMFAKVSVAGDDQAPLYQHLTDEKTNPKFAGKIRWNFDKFLVSRDGEIIARFAPRTKPTAKALLKAIEDALSKPVPQAAKAYAGKRNDKTAE